MDNISCNSPAPEQEQDPPPGQKLKNEFERAKQATSNVKADVSDQAAAYLESAKANLKEAARGATEYGQGLFNEQKSKFAEAVEEYCRAAESTSGRLRQEGHTGLASRGDVLASRFRRLASYLRERELFDIYHDAEQFTRRRPEMVFGITFAAGLMAARFLKASKRGGTSGRAADADVPEHIAQTASTEPLSRETS
jgi:hypothetical protein